MALTSKQIAFCESYILTNNATEAYQKAYNNTNMATCRVNASKMLKMSDIIAKMSELRNAVKKLTTKRLDKSIENTTDLFIMSVSERMNILSKIANGEIPLQKAIVVDKNIEYIEVVPDWMDRKNAIAELNKMDGSYTPIEQKIKVSKLGKELADEIYVE